MPAKSCQCQNSGQSNQCQLKSCQYSSPDHISRCRPQSLKSKFKNNLCSNSRAITTKKSPISDVLVVPRQEKIFWGGKNATSEISEVVFLTPQNFLVCHLGTPENSSVPGWHARNSWRTKLARQKTHSSLCRLVPSSRVLLLVDSLSQEKKFAALHAASLPPPSSSFFLFGLLQFLRLVI